MPKATFFNLPEEKRQRLIDLAVEEFATHDYRVASVSRIVARAGIAKGSLYQYFDDKRELFLYLLDVAVEQRRLDFLHVAQAAVAEAGFFDQLRWMLRGSVQTARAHPHLLQLALRASRADLPFADEALERCKALGREYLRELVGQGIARGELAAGLDPEVATAIIVAVMTEFNALYLKRLGVAPDALAGTDLDIFETETAQRLFDDFIAILEHGLAALP